MPSVLVEVKDAMTHATVNFKFDPDVVTVHRLKVII
jgi:hypothetical protein